MDKENMTAVTVIQLLGIQTSRSITFVVFFLFIMFYCVTICGNLLIILMVSYSNSLHSPMYFFLSQLSVSDMLLITDVVPNMLHAVLENCTIMSVFDCITQFYFFAATESLECLLLTAMSYDRYLAICKPLHYKMLMNQQICLVTVIASWSFSFLLVLIYILTISKLHFCGSNIVDHFFCDLEPILHLSCSDTTIVQLEATILSVIFGVIPFVIIVVSYVYIIVTIFEIPSITGRQKVFSTCSSHLTVVSIFYGTMFCVYLVPGSGQSLNVTKYFSLLYTVLTPLMNPIIYSLRNKDLKKVVRKILSNSCSLYFYKH